MIIKPPINEAMYSDPENFIMTTAWVKFFTAVSQVLGSEATTVRIISTDSPYTLLSTDYVIFGDTDGGAIITAIPAGVEGASYKIINCGSSANDITVDPNGAEEIYGGATHTVADGESIVIHYNVIEGWY